MSKVIVLGAKGRFGRAAVKAFAQAGWTVTAFGRNWKEDPGVRVVTGDAADAAALSRACAGQDVIVNALNPAYEDWAQQLPGLTRATIAAARASSAAVLLPGNVYNFGAQAPMLLREDTPWRPSTCKGRLRAEMETAYHDAGVPTIVLRGGDFLDTARSGNWFDRVIAPRARQGRTTYPGPTDRAHAWAYLPDMARAAVLLAEKRAALPGFAQVNFPGYALTGAELAEAIGQATGKPQKIAAFPWIAVRLLGLMRADMGALLEMRYLWQVPHRLDGQRLEVLLPQFRATPLAEAMKTVILG